MTAHDLTVWDQAWRAGAIFGSLVGVAFGTVAVWYAGRLVNRFRARRNGKVGSSGSLSGGVGARDGVSPSGGTGPKDWHQPTAGGIAFGCQAERQPPEPTEDACASTTLLSEPLSDAGAVERDLICRSGLTWPALYDQDQDRRWQR